MLAKIEQAQSEQAFFNADKLGLIDKLPALLRVVTHLLFLQVIL